MLEFDPDVSTVYDPVIVVIFNLYPFDFIKDELTIQVQPFYSNAIGGAKLQVRESDVDLANEISRVTRVKYQNGVGSNLEVLNAESSIKESQANYFTALYNALIAKVEVEKANGTLYID